MDNRVHALSHEMESKSTRTEFARGKSLKGIGLGFRSMVDQDNFQAFFHAIFGTNFIEPDLDRAVHFTAICVADNVGNGFIYGKSDGAAILFAETHRLCDRRNRSPNATKNRRVAQQLKPQKKLPPWQR